MKDNQYNADQKEKEFKIDQQTVVINLWTTPRLKKIAAQSAIRKGMSLSAFIRNLIIQDNE